MLLGEYEHTIDDKNRLTLPARFRDSFRGGVVLTRGVERCLEAYPPGEWQRHVEDRLAPLDRLSSETRKLERHLYAGAVEAELDKQGRVMIPAPLAKYAGLGREVVVAGVRNRLEIWDRPAWREQLEDLEGRAEDVAERLAAKRD